MKLPFLFTLFCSVALRAQIDTAITVPLVAVHLSAQLPYGDMASRYGTNLNAGGSFLIKTSSNWLFGLESGYLFGRNVKEDVTSQMKNDQGFIIDNEGFPADLRITQRGITFQLVGGRVFKFLSVNPNSGPLLMLGAGFMQHHIKLYDAQQRIAAVEGDLVKGYDRLSAGFCLSQFVGYLYLSKNRYANFYAGLEFYHGFTRSVRGFNYDKGLPDTSRRMDGLAGFRFGWILPLYKKKPNEFYYY